MMASKEFDADISALIANIAAFEKKHIRSGKMVATPDLLHIASQLAAARISLLYFWEHTDEFICVAK